MTNKKWTWILAAAVSATLAGTSMAQYRIQGDGRARDANNRLGSMGSNNPIGPQQNAQYNNFGNYLITGNVTGGREFRGFVPYTDPTAFRGTTASQLSDDFIRQSSGAPFGGVANNNAQVVQPFFSQGRYSTPPPTFVPQGPASNVYVPGQTMMRGPGDLRLGDAIPTTSTTLLPLPGQLVLPGPVESNTQSTSLITASPLYGVRKWDLSGQADQTFLNNTLSTAANGPVARFDPIIVEKLRSELLSPAGPIDQQIDNNAGAGTATMPENGLGTLNLQNQRGPRGDQRSDQPLQAPMESPQNAPIRGASAVNNNAINSGAGVFSTSDTGAGLQRHLVGARQQSAKYDELSRRLQQYRVVQQMADSQAQRDFQQQQQQQKEQGQGKQTPGGNVTTPTPSGGAVPPGGTGAQQPTPGGTGPGGAAMPNMPNMPGQNQTQQPNKVEIPGTSDMTPSMNRPVQIKSLAEGVKAKGLGDLLTEAETQMKAGKYNAALEAYDMAEQVAPNNPLILIGRANVELARTYYARAEADLRKAFMQDEALLMGQYDLRSMIGDERLNVLDKELREISNREQKEPRPVFLLAYLYYNTGNERKAAAYLDLAEKRAGANDPLYPMIRKHWALPKDAGPAPGDLNK
jgi:tetratricopeptide (TPR) repeat protein